ncbi:hypothetical protein AB0M41_38275 [Streptomyces sp. NPDC051896]|uniref:hypothetical protein n=1 Tax=Streptomyces sp. NPDC051896 TaxID=3155416 RepID=UPI00342EE8FE
MPQAYEGAIPVSERKPTSDRSIYARVSDPACQRVLDIARGEGASAVVDQTFNWKDNIFPGGSTLAAYEDTEAQAAFNRLGEGLKMCRSFTGTNYAGKYRSKLALESSPQVGDEALRYNIESPMADGRVHDEDYVVVRVGSTIATFNAIDVGKRASFPSDLIAKQVERIKGVQRR